MAEKEPPRTRCVDPPSTRALGPFPLLDGVLAVTSLVAWIMRRRAPTTDKSIRIYGFTFPRSRRPPTKKEFGILYLAEPQRGKGEGAYAAVNRSRGVLHDSPGGAGGAGEAGWRR